MNIIRPTLTLITGCLLTACVNTEQMHYYSGSHSDTSYDTPQEYYYTQNYSSYNYSYDEPRARGEVTVPESYHVGAYHSPTPAKDRDKTWVNNQPSGNYTIQISNDEKAAAVARKLNQMPKNDRTAEIKYQENGKSYYKGLYGSYSNKEDAQKALDSLPAEAKQGAGIQTFGTVQSGMSE